MGIPRNVNVIHFMSWSFLVNLASQIIHKKHSQETFLIWNLSSSNYYHLTTTANADGVNYCTAKEQGYSLLWNPLQTNGQLVMYICATVCKLIQLRI